MKKAILIVFIFSKASISFGQISIDSIASNIDKQVKQGLLEFVRKSDNPPPCETSFYYGNKKLRMIKIECGDVSLTMTETKYYFENELILYRYKETIFNATPTYTKEKAQKEGLKGGWFDETKTKVEVEKCYFSNEKMTRWINSRGEEIDIRSKEFSEKERQVQTDLKSIIK